MQKLSNRPHFERQEEIIKTSEFCPTCRHWFFSPNEREHIENTLECLSCEHITGERKIYGK